MKKLGKLSINPEKVIKNEELVNLKGGDYGGGTCYVSCKNANGDHIGGLWTTDCNDPNNATRCSLYPGFSGAMVCVC